MNNQDNQKNEANKLLPYLFESFDNQKELEEKVRKIAEEIDEETLYEIMRELHGIKIQTFYKRILGCLLLFAEEKFLKKHGISTFGKYYKDYIRLHKKKRIPTEAYDLKSIVENWDYIEKAVDKENKKIYELSISDLSNYLPSKKKINPN